MRASLPLVLTVSAALLAACGKSQDSTPVAPPPPADAPATTADFTRPLNALGDAPFWALKIRPDGLTFSTTAEKDLIVRNRGPRAGADQAVWSATDGDGKPLTAVLRAKVCQDPATGLSYPFTATVETGGRTLSGCAAYADAMPKGGS
ncbi:MAG TPA: hypothetical protein VL358_05765 [Caulobacteraceae bacterium]|jgi:uncharacterized membrane protein|nr:hypothetical protein [Caulobacteraceae bacterium]